MIWWLLPIREQGELWKMRDESKTKRQLIGELVKLRQRVAELEAADIERKGVEEALRHQRDELAARSAILSATLRTTDLDKLLHLILDEVLTFLGAEFASIHLVQADQVVLRAWRGLSAAFRAQVLVYPADEPPDWMREARVVHEYLNEVDVTPDFAKGEGIQAWAAIPLRLPPKDGAEERWLGTLMVGSRRYEALSEDDVRALQAMSDQLALAIEHLRTHRQALERLTRLQTLRAIDKGIIQRLDLREVLHVVLEQVPKELGADVVAISLLDEEQLRPEVFVMHLPNGTLVEEKAFELAESLLHWFVERQEPVIIYDLTQDPRVQVHRERIRNDKLISYLGVPLVVRDKTMGILHIITTQPKVFADEDVAFFRTMAGQAAIAIENARLYEAVRQELAERIEAEEELAKVNRYMRAIFSSTKEAIFTISMDRRIQSCNRAAQEVLGYPESEMVGQTMAKFYPSEEAYLDFGKRLYLALEEKGYFAGEFELRRANGEIFPAEFMVSVLKTDEEPLGLVTVLRDITERKRAERLLQALNRAALAMEQALTTEEIFAAVAKELKKLGLSCLVLLTDESQSRLFVKHWSYEAGAIEFLEELIGFKIEDFSIPIETTDIYREVIQERRAVFVDNVEGLARQLLPESLKGFTGQIVRILKITKSIPAPLIVGDEVFGILSVESDDLTEEDIPAITAFAHQMAAAWRKAMLLQDLGKSLTELERVEEELRHTAETLRKTLGATIQAMALTVEARDPYTAGHQRRVADLARAIAEEMGLSKERIEGIRVAGGLHDIGKINIPAEILGKPGRINNMELGLIKMHPQVGYNILKGIEFPWPVAQIVLQHHERMDGSGYPQGLVGGDIVLEARILAVADVVEAMSSHRPYRPAHNIDKALEEISQNSGILYDPEVADVCLRLFTEKGFKLE
jgi:PAS domain S-box-containing protein/putative nucleotidyltransferase with HDIG domain